MLGGWVGVGAELWTWRWREKNFSHLVRADIQLRLCT